MKCLKKKGKISEHEVIVFNDSVKRTRIECNINMLRIFKPYLIKICSLSFNTEMWKRSGDTDNNDYCKMIMAGVIIDLIMIMVVVKMITNSRVKICLRIQIFYTSPEDNVLKDAFQKLYKSSKVSSAMFPYLHFWEFIFCNIVECMVRERDQCLCMYAQTCTCMHRSMYICMPTLFHWHRNSHTHTHITCTSSDDDKGGNRKFWYIDKLVKDKTL